MKVEGKTRQTNAPGILCCTWAPGAQMERFVRVPYGLYQGYGNTMPLGHPGLSEHKQPDWRRNTGPPTFLARPGLLVPANASDYCMDPYKRAQLKAVLSQMNPSLSLRLSKANTREVGVQLQREEEDQERKALLGPAEASQQQQSPPTPRLEEDKQEELHQHDGLEEEDASSPRERKSKQAQGVGGADLLRKPNFQLLEPKYGYFHCKDCKTRWESAYVWCISGTNKVYFKQLCCKCQKSFNPYRVEAIQCQTCSKSRCSCPQKKRHVDLRRPHRQELCGRCKDKKFSCGNTYSFKFIM
ncbi:ZAR1-like protein isoform X5 [Ailuropoda melanoleuca]|uniref:ZAR1-like protein isoform X5 n=1 Tax=Ailuropoda melanoleuca TaxID=9646 RepID=UPI0014940282|nr:ZAR1-like protein isoform X5 [Ailuropoda melanoleuca]